MSLSQKLASGTGLSADKLFRAGLTAALIAAAALALSVAGTLLFTSLPLWGQQSPLTFLTEQNWLTGVAQADGSTLDVDRKSTRLNSSHSQQSRMPSSA